LLLLLKHDQIELDHDEDVEGKSHGEDRAGEPVS
jgi:hypothetical protein